MSQIVNKSVFIYGVKSDECSFRFLTDKLKNDRFSVKLLGSDLNLKQLPNNCIILISNRTGDFSDKQVQKFKQFLNKGGKLLISLSDAFDKTTNQTFNRFLNEYGVDVDTDCIIRAHYYQYYHPKECYLNDANIHAVLKNRMKLNGSEDITFVYPNGVSFNIEKPSVALLSSGFCTIPVNRAIVVSSIDFQNDGKLLILGSSAMLSDRFLSKENNWLLIQSFFEYLLTPISEIQKSMSDDYEIDINETKVVPDIIELSDKPKAYLDEAMNFTRSIDCMDLFDDDLYSVSLTAVPNVLKLYDQLDVKREETLSLIAPKFETPLPSFEPAVFGPIFMDITGPDLEQFNFDDEFRSDQDRIVQTKSNDDNDSERLRNFEFDCDTEQQHVIRPLTKSGVPKYIS